ncbi:MAG: LamG domain-containing protein [Acidobacteriaceae bacterium]|nr:LamG domain-containing protein [Acidobacteriaceae bacterium]
MPPSSSFEVPAPNACQSRYDQFYKTERGVYAYWALCESGDPIQIYDYAGRWDLSRENHTWGTGAIVGGASGPVPDGETAAVSRAGSDFVENQDILMNKHQGTVAAWVNPDATQSEETALMLSALDRHSEVSLGVSAGDSICFTGNLVSSDNESHLLRKCGFDSSNWHRVVFTWNDGIEKLYVDGTLAEHGSYTGALDDWVFYYKLFPGSAAAGKMALAKALVANEAWTDSETARDFSPELPPVPAGGIYVSASRLGTIHRDVLGYADFNQDISTPQMLSALKKGMKAGGFTSVRYAGSYGGITADESNWRGGPTCVYGHSGETAPALNIETRNTMDTFIPMVAQPLGQNLGYTVNYGTNPPACNAPGDPVKNGADLVRYANLTKRYGIKYWEIGNEVYSKTTEMDLHPNPNTGVSYVTYEPAFYDAMKAVDPAIKIAVPIALNVYSWTTEYSIPILISAKYDAIVFHNYPMTHPITDGNTIYPERVSSNLQLRGQFSWLKTALMNAGKNPDAIWVTEWNGSVEGNRWSKQTMGAVFPMFAVTQLAEYMQAGVPYATWWVQGMTGVCTVANYDDQGESAYNWWGCGNNSLIYTAQQTAATETHVGLKMGDLVPAARGFQILAQSGFVTEGEHMLQTYPDLQGAPWLLSYAATHGKSHAVILINRDRDRGHVVPVRLENQDAGFSVRQWTYGRAQYDQTRHGNWSTGPAQTKFGPWKDVFHAVLPPWSVNVLIFGD